MIAQEDYLVMHRLSTRQCDIDKLLRRFHSKASNLIFAYETDPCGYVLHRYLTGKGFTCLPAVGATTVSGWVLGTAAWAGAH